MASTFYSRFLDIVLLAILLNHRSLSTATKCSGGAFDSGLTAYVTCYFDEDISQKDYNVNFRPSDKRQDSKEVVLCNWNPENLQHICQRGQGVNFTRLLTHQLSVWIPNVTPSYDGNYTCEIVHGDSSHNENCRLIIRDSKFSYNTSEDNMNPQIDSSSIMEKSKSGDNSMLNSPQEIIVFVIVGILFFSLLFLFLILRVWCKKRNRNTGAPEELLLEELPTERQEGNAEPEPPAAACGSSVDPPNHDDEPINFGNGSVSATVTSSQGGPKVLRVVVLGRTHAGKSTLGNTLLGRWEKDQFREHRDLTPDVGECELKQGLVLDGRLSLEVVDTPGLCDDKFPKDRIVPELLNFIKLTGEGPHVILFVQRSDKAPDALDMNAFQAIKQQFSEEMNKHLIFVFTKMDFFDDGSEPREGEEFIAKQQNKLQESLNGYPEDWQKAIMDAQGFVGINNSASIEDRKKQASSLIEKMMDLKKNNLGRCYVSKVIDILKEELEREVHQEMEEKQVSEETAMETVRKSLPLTLGKGEDLAQKLMRQDIGMALLEVASAKMAQQACHVM